VVDLIANNFEKFVEQIATQIAFIHKAGFVWDDPKHDNIVYDEDS
jgi:tRNA A-37 threonylcarbamoyl transferase component Bud32